LNNILFDPVVTAKFGVVLVDIRADGDYLSYDSNNPIFRGGASGGLGEGIPSCF
jgi:hypothetical protein